MDLDFKDKDIIAVIGGKKCGDKTYQMAEEVGKLIAERDGILISGGRSGVMEAASKGAAKNGGLTIGVLPGLNKDNANEWIQITLPTGIGLARNSVIVNSCDAAIAIDGSYGTLSEIAYCYQFKKPVCLLNSWKIEKAPKVDSPEEAVEFAFSSIRE